MRFSVPQFVAAFMAGSANASPQLVVDGSLLDGVFHKRQVVGTGVTSASASSTPDESSSTTPSATPSSTPPPPPPSSSTPAPPPPGSSSSPPDPGSSTPAPSSSSSASSSNTSRETVTTPLIGTSTRRVTTVLSTTRPDGSVELITSTSTEVLSSTTGFSTITRTPGLQASNSGSGGGLSSSSKSIIGGVVGGVGGAILLGGIAIVLWRVYGRKRNQSADYDDTAGSAVASYKPASSSGVADDESHLDRYNQHARPNAASNF